MFSGPPFCHQQNAERSVYVCVCVCVCVCAFDVMYRRVFVTVCLCKYLCLDLGVLLLQCEYAQNTV